MEHVIEPAASGRAKCRGCGEKIAKGELRLGARLPNPFVEGELTLWFHLACGAYKRPEPLLEALKTTPETFGDSERLVAEAKRSLDHQRLPRLNGADRAPTRRASCRSCRKTIDKGAFRISLVFYEEEEGRFQPAGFLHVACAKEYFGTSDVMERLRHFSPELEEGDLDELRVQLSQPTANTE